MPAGFIYILTNPAFQSDLLKIGKTTRTPSERAREIATTGVPAEFIVSFDIATSDCDYAEAVIHHHLTQERYAANREFFRLPLPEAIAKVTAIVEDVEKTPLEDRLFVPRQRKVNFAKPRNIRALEPAEVELDSEVSKGTAFIKKATRTIFRQNNQLLDGAEIFFKLSGTFWSKNNETKAGMVYFSRPSGNLVILPKCIVNQYIFDRFFEKQADGYQLSGNYKQFEYDNGRINLKFKTDHDRLLMYLKAPSIFQIDPIPLISLPTAYWPEMKFQKTEAVVSIVAEINDLCQSLSQGHGIKSITSATLFRTSAKTGPTSQRSGL